MRKCLSIFCSIIIIVFSTIPVSAINDGDDMCFTKMELNLKRFRDKICGVDNVDTATSILLELGLTEEIAKGISEDYLKTIYNAKCIELSVEHEKIDANGNTSSLSEEEYEIELSDMKNDGVSTLSLGGEIEETRSDSLFNKYICVIEPNNSPKGIVSVLCSFQWIGRPVYRGWDVVAVSASHFEIDEEAVFLSVYYQEEFIQLQTSYTETEDIYLNYDFNDLDDGKHIKYAENFIAAEFDMPVDVYTSQTNLFHNNITAILGIEIHDRTIDKDEDFTVTGWYFHQKMLWTLGFGIDSEGASISITPEIKYNDPSQIQISPIYYV